MQQKYPSTQTQKEAGCKHEETGLAESSENTRSHIAWDAGYAGLEGKGSEMKPDARHFCAFFLASHCGPDADT